MKHVVYNKREFASRGRVVSIREQYEDKECLTRVMKNFVYLINRIDSMPDAEVPPQIRMIKAVENFRREESFVFKVKGVMYIREKRFIYAVRYCHSLVIRLFWKSPVPASKPAALA